MSSNFDSQFYQFINFIFSVIVISAAGLFIIQGDNIVTFGRFMEFLAPIILVAGAVMLFKRFRDPQQRMKRIQKYSDIKLFLTHLDKMKADVFMFVLPVLIITIAFIMQGKLYLVDLIQAIFSFFAFYYFQRWLFKKK